jgi:hypothetical protein
MAAASIADFDGDVDRLYQLPLNEFTAARDELVKRLRAEGERERAQEIKTLRKPTAAVWLVNQLARERPLDVQRLLKAGESLTKSQANAAAGKSSQTFPEARRAEQRALEQLAKAAGEIAERAGIGSPVLAKAMETLRAASLSDDGRDLLRRGRLTEELEPPGFEALTGLERLAQKLAPPNKEAPRRDDRAEKRTLKQARERVRQLRAEERELATAARSAAREAQRAEAEAGAARNRAADADEKALAMSDRRKAAEADLDRLG